MQTKDVKPVDRDVKQTDAIDARKRILLVDDHAVVRFGIAQLVNRQPDLVVCGEQEDARKALDAIDCGSFDPAKESPPWPDACSGLLVANEDI